MKTNKNLAGGAKAVAALVVGLALAGTAMAQTKKAPAKAAPAKAAQSAEESLLDNWVKLCNKIGFKNKDKDGKEVNEDRTVCITRRDGRETRAGRILLSVEIKQMEKEEKQFIGITLPTGMILPAGVRVGVYPKDAWEKVKKGEVDDKHKVKGLAAPYVVCNPGSCLAEAPIPPDVLGEMKTAAGIMVFAINAQAGEIGFPMPLEGFNKAYTGAPADTAKYAEAFKQSMLQVRARERELAEEYQKKNEQLQKMQGPEAYKGAVPAPGKK
ncbi:MAG TPA: invasion associated locus B family protein [Hyphomicrobiaceae bacterium]|jgi:invasion protein IalB|nr:invasion associated locus B family protein [Hyphomicrobiaceae bacterium]